MKSYHYKIFYLLSFFLSLFFVCKSNAQNNTLFYMSNVPQASLLNPAMQPSCGFYIGLGSTYFNVSDNAITFNDIFFKDKNDSVSYFIQSSEETDKFLSKLDKQNFVSVQGGSDLLTMGFRINRMYFNFGIGIESDNKILFPKDLASFLTIHLPEDAHFDLSSFNIQMNEYFDIGLGISRRFGDRVTLGVRPKLLLGIANISSNTHSFFINSAHHTGDLTFDINSDVNISAPLINIPENSDGTAKLSDISMGNLDTLDYTKAAFANKGFGLDAGLNFRPAERIELSASIINLGYIKWKSSSYKYSMQGSYTYTGLEYNSSDSNSKNMGSILDSIGDNFKLKQTGRSFTSNLTPTLYVGGRFLLAPALDIGAIGRFDFYKDKTMSNIILLMDWRPFSVWNVSASYSLLDRSKSTFGLGMTFKLWIFDLYLVTDDISTTYTSLILKNKDSNSVTSTKGFGIPIPDNMLSYNLKFGLNLMLGSNVKKKLRTDQPMYISADY